MAEEEAAARAAPDDVDGGAQLGEGFGLVEVDGLGARGGGRVAEGAEVGVEGGEGGEAAEVGFGDREGVGVLVGAVGGFRVEALGRDEAF